MVQYNQKERDEQLNNTTTTQHHIIDDERMIDYDDEYIMLQDQGTNSVQQGHQVREEL